MTRDCLILGSGRSGTSLATGMLTDAGYFMGAELWPADIGNPKGYFEDREINSINDELLAPLVPARRNHGIRRWINGRGYPLKRFQRWLAVVPPGRSIICPPEIAMRIETATRHHPFCFKDPRLCYTLPVWRPFIADAVLICVFRDPATTANSILSECRRAPYLKGIRMDFTRALQIWEAMYRHVLEVHYPRGGDWLFVHYEQLLNGDARHRLEAKLQTVVAADFASEELKRSKASDGVPRRFVRLYERLCELAGM